MISVADSVMPKMSSLDHNLVNTMSKYVEVLTTSGKPELDETLMKNLKRICKKSDEYVEHVFHMLMTQLNQGHSEIRLSAFLICDELFNRSHRFRELLLADFQIFLGLTAEINYNEPLPPPKKAAKILKSKTYKAIQKWHDKYAEEYRKLALAYNYLKNCKKINFTEIQARAEAERQREEAEQQRTEMVMQQKLSSCLHEMTELQPEIRNCLSQLDSCMKLLLPTLDDFEINADDCIIPDVPESSQKGPLIDNYVNKNMKGEMSKVTDERNYTVKQGLSMVNVDKPHCIDNTSAESGTNHFSSTDIMHCDDAENGISERMESMNNDDISQREEEEEEEDEEEEEGEEMEDVPESDLMRQHGLGSMKYNITIDIEPGVIKENEDNTDILNAVRDSSKLIANRYLPLVITWLKILTNNGGQQEHISQLEKLKQNLEAALQKYKEMKIPELPPKLVVSVTEDDAEGDFETVPEKEGYEEDIPEHLKEYSSIGCTPSTSSTTSSTSKSGDICHTEWQSKGGAVKEEWDLKVTNKKSESEHVDSLSNQESSISGEDARKQKLLKKAPVVHYDMDLQHWENPDAKPPAVVRIESGHRFWTPRELNEDFVNNESLEALRTRTIEFSGTFEPVKWKCRAPMPSGKLCERMDRIKCPFHGKIIPRDEQGKPSNPDDVVRIKEEEDKKKAEAVPDWQDPVLLRELEAATGIDLTVTAGKRGKGKGKGKGKKKFPNLTDIKAAGNTSRRRLEKKVLNKSALRRVTNALDSLDYKLAKDRFANQFNYALK
ncbi:UV-stimulated scaffold protein A [Lingula anatina]|uniref:UV-stimulated scaffold protein A n=1 Tax=Lingula anatina TaxID=7574 RepID=A0A1S3HA79_LINAN|nr:UV-stimulated scaffold protein A [Lingula anatina]|eukprot:XP_013383000.1 UV-stimulated scaffold protein A [Lingula anatina]